MSDEVNHPTHYNWIPGIEVADITDHLNFNIGNVVKYVLRAGHKSDNALLDLQKALWYLEREIELIQMGYRDDSELTSLYEYCQAAFGNDDPLTISIGNKLRAASSVQR